MCGCPAMHTRAMPHNWARKSQPIAFGTGLIALDLILDSRDSGKAAVAAGGTCGNVLAILAFFGWESHAVARLGGDIGSRQVHMLLEKAGVSLDFAELTPPC